MIDDELRVAAVEPDGQVVIPAGLAREPIPALPSVAPRGGRPAPFGDAGAVHLR